MTDPHPRPDSVCITGGGGFIGSHLCDALLARSLPTCVIDDWSSGRRSNLPVAHPLLRVVDGSILDDSALDRAMSGAGCVFHLAAFVSAPLSVKQPRACHDINTSGTLRVLEAAVRHRVRRVVFASSAAVYGDSEVVPKREDQPLQPCSVYAQSKAAGEHLLRVWRLVHGIEAVSLRFFNVFGPRQSASSGYAAAISAFASAIIRGTEITIHGDGEQTRDFVPVGDLVRALILAGSKPGIGNADVINIGTGAAITVRQLARRMCQLADAPERIRFEPARPGDVRHSRADVSAAHTLLGFQPSPDLDTPLRQTLDWYRREGSAQ